MTRTITSADESPVFIRSQDEDLFAILTRPAGKGNGIGLVMLLGGPFTLSFNRNRLSVHLARQFASLGYHVLRFDTHGMGESSGKLDAYDLERPYRDDVEAAARWLQTQGVDRIVLMGSCFGARSCLAAAENISGVSGVALCSMPVLSVLRQAAAIQHAREGWIHVFKRAFQRDVRRRLLNRKVRGHYARIAKLKIRGARRPAAAKAMFRPSPSVLRHLTNLITNRVPTLLAYGSEEFWDEFQWAREGPLGDVLSSPGAPVEIHHDDELSLHGFSTLESQRRATALLEDWLSRIGNGALEGAGSTTRGALASES